MPPSNVRTSPSVKARLSALAARNSNFDGKPHRIAYIGMRKTELDYEKTIWSVPASRMKGGCDHVVPLSDQAIEILQALPSETGHAADMPKLTRMAQRRSQVTPLTFPSDLLEIDFATLNTILSRIGEQAPIRAESS